MNVHRKTLLMLILMLLGFAFIYIGLNIPPLGFLATIGAWLAIILLYYDYRRAQKEMGTKTCSTLNFLSFFSTAKSRHFRR